MKINRSTQCSLKFSTENKQEQLNRILNEYGKTVNQFIDFFWINGTVSKTKLLKEIVDTPSTWLSARLRKVAAREALDMIKSTQEVHQSNKKQLELSIKAIEYKIETTPANSTHNRRKLNNWYKSLKRKKTKIEHMQPTKPKHTGNRMHVSCTIAELQQPKKTNKFDNWLHLASIGNKMILDIPIKLHKHFNILQAKGKRLNDYIITRNYVQFGFEIETGEKKETNKVLGVDTGINALASTSDNEQLGTDIKEKIEKIKRSQKGSKKQKSLIRGLKQRIDEVAKEIANKTDLVVVEKLRNMNNNSKLKGRLSKNIRSSIGSWNYSYWLDRLQQKCEENRVTFRTVCPSYTSQECFQCGHIDRGNRNGEIFRCRRCDHSCNADVNAARNILERFLSGPYGAAYKPEEISEKLC